MKERRMPRPLGMTYQSIHYNKETEESKKEIILKKIQSIYIDQYVTNSGYLMGNYMTIDNLGSLLKMGTMEVMRAMNRTMERISKLMGMDENNHWARAAILGQLKKAQEAQSLAEMQVHILLASQGSEYRPFLSSEVIKAMKVYQDSTKPVMEILKTFNEKSATNIFTFNTQNNVTNASHITIAEASKMLTESSQPSLLAGGEELKSLSQSLESLPNVNAKSQDLSSIGIRYKPPVIRDSDEDSDYEEVGKD